MKSSFGFGEHSLLLVRTRSNYSRSYFVGTSLLGCFKCASGNATDHGKPQKSSVGGTVSTFTVCASLFLNRYIRRPFCRIRVDFGTNSWTFRSSSFFSLLHPRTLTTTRGHSLPVLESAFSFVVHPFHHEDDHRAIFKFGCNTSFLWKKISLSFVYYIRAMNVSKSLPPFNSPSHSRVVQPSVIAGHTFRHSGSRCSRRQLKFSMPTAGDSHFCSSPRPVCAHRSVSRTRVSSTQGVPYRG